MIRRLGPALFSWSNLVPLLASLVFLIYRFGLSLDCVRIRQLSPRRPLRRHRFPRLRKCLDQGCFRQRDYLRPGVFPPSLGIVRSMLGSLGFVRPAFRHRRPHRRPHVLPRRACLSRFLQDPPEGGEGGLAATARDPAQTPQGSHTRRERQRVCAPRDREHQ